MTKKFALTMMAVAAAAVTPFVVAPAAQAEICAGDVGRHVGIGGCTNVIGDVADTAIAGAAVAGAVGVGEVAAANRWGFPGNYAVSEFPAFPGEAPCISPSGLPYYTPGNTPCY